MHDTGTVFWITGLSGAGKTSISSGLVKLFKENAIPVIHLDGDALRAVFAVGDAHTPEERLALAKRYSRLCKEISDQGIHVICSTISMFNEVREKNRSTIKRYKEVYLKVPMEVLIKRDQKGLYSGGLKGNVDNVIGLNTNFQEPQKPDKVIINDGTTTPKTIIKNIFDEFCIDLK